MLDRRTVLVLGAGASIPYGFPSGPQLRDQILAVAAGEPRTGPQLADQLRSLLPDSLPDAVKEHRAKVLNPSTRIAEFERAFKKSQLSSIDAFLTWRGEFEDIGKLCIAQVLAPLESTQVLSGVGVSDSWYPKLWNRMSSGLRDSESSNLTIVTLNYDRSFEEFFTQAAANSFGWDIHVSREKIADLIPIHHVHGSLGSWPAEEYGYLRRRNGAAQPDAAFRGSPGIRVLHEGGTYESATKALRDAEIIGFLGFSYHEMVLKNLFPADRWHVQSHKPKPKPMILGTAYGLGAAERRAVEVTISTLASVNSAKNVQIGEPDWKNLQALEEMPIITPL